MLLAIKNKDRHYEWAYGPGDTHFYHRIGFCSNLSIRIEDKARIVFAVVPLDAQLRMKNKSCERAALVFALLHCTASTIWF